MPDNDEPTLEDVQARLGNFVGCCPALDTVFEPFGVQVEERLLFSDLCSNACPERLEPVPTFFSDPAWRERAVAERAKFPAGYTYFSQLVGHDIGNSVSLARVPYSFTGTVQQAIAEGRDPTRYNLIENALTLETIYGQGPTIATHLYDPATFKFDIRPEDNITRTFSDRHEKLHAIHDNRNRDTTMLHRMTASIMKYHNKIVEEIEPNDATLRYAPVSRKLEVYACARAHMIDIWHAVIRTDLVPVMLMDPGVSLDRVKDKDKLSDTTLLHGVFRVFHALPLKKYKFSQQHFCLGEVLASNPVANEEVRAGWSIDWHNFFDRASAANMTGFSASITRGLSNSLLNLPKLDALSVMITNPLRLDDPRIDAFTQFLPQPYKEQATPDRLAKDFKAAYDIDIAPKTLGCGALFVALMVEAHLHGPDGKLGPLGSLLLASALESRMQAVKKMAVPNQHKLSMPASMLELIQSV